MEMLCFFNNFKQLLKKLELIIGEIMAGDTGVAILDMLLKTLTYNKAQHEKIIKTISKYKIM